VCVCVCVCVFVCAYKFASCIRACIPMPVSVSVLVCDSVVCVCVHARVHVYVWVHACVCVCMYRNDLEVGHKCGKGAYGGVYVSKISGSTETVVVKVAYPDPDLNPKQHAKSGTYFVHMFVRLNEYVYLNMQTSIRVSTRTHNDLAVTTCS